MCHLGDASAVSFLRELPCGVRQSQHVHRDCMERLDFCRSKNVLNLRALLQLHNERQTLTFGVRSGAAGRHCTATLSS